MTNGVPIIWYAKECRGDPWENRTPDSAVRGLRLNRLTNRPYLVETIGLEPMTLCL